MPEGDTIFRAARTLQRALGGQLVTRFETVLPHLQRIHDDAPVTGRTVESVTAHGKWMAMHFSGDLVLISHMRMNGSWHIYRTGERWRRPRFDMRVVVGTRDYEAIAFNVPVAEFQTAESLARHESFRRLGPDVLAPEFDPSVAIAQLKSVPELEVGVALLRQSVLAGIGNVYKSEICFACGVHPFRQVASLTEAELDCLARTARKFMLANVQPGTDAGIVTYTGFRRTTQRANPGDRLWVYGRAGEPCRRCATPIQMQKQGSEARVTFWCPGCQK